MVRFSTGSYQDMKHGFSVWSATEETIGHLVFTVIARKEENTTGQVIRQGNAWTVFDSSGIVHTEFIPEWMTVNNHCYREIPRHLYNSMHCKCPELWYRKQWLLLHDIALAHRSILVPEELAKKQGTILPHPPYSLGLTSCNFFFVPSLKVEQHGHRFQLTRR
jgi:hypothetical protein